MSAIDPRHHLLAARACDTLAPAPGTPLGQLLLETIDALRHQLADPTAPIAVISPSSANGTLLRQQLARAGSFVRVDFFTPEHLVNSLGRAALIHDPRHLEPPGWLSATLGHLLHTLDDHALAGYRDTLTVPGWRTALEQAIQRLEQGRITPDALRATLHSAPRPRRLDLLATLLEGVQHARERDGLLGPVELQQAARRSAGEPCLHRLEQLAAAIVVGDRTLSPTVSEGLLDWCSRRPVVRLAIAPLEQLDPAPLGMREATLACPVVCAPPRDHTLDQLRERLFTDACDAPLPDDRSITLARTPDELRELDELVRAVQAAIVHDAVPLDEIAIILPNAEHADVLQDALERAAIPATWLVGPSLARSPAASFLSLAVDMATRPATAEQFYEVLVQPAFALRPRLGPRATTGRGRWRRLLATCGAHRGCDAIIQALRQRLETDPDPDPDRPAVDSLTLALRALQDALDALPEHATLPEHGHALHQLLETWWLPSSDRERTLDLLASWGQRPVGPVLDRATAGALVLETLAATQLLDGNLSAPRVRVLPPMSALGCAARRVFVAGLDEGRLPRPRSEHPILGDDEVRFLAETLGVRLSASHDHADTERRRLAAALSACTERLWLSWAASDMLEARPRLPGRLLLEVATALLGHRATFDDLRTLAVQHGSRGRPVPADPARALGPLEHLCARALGDQPRPVLEALATHPSSRRLLALHRAQARLRLDEPPHDPTLDAHTHHVDPALLETPDAHQHPTSADALARLVLRPGDELLEQQLGARTAPRFYPDAGLERRARSRIVRALTAALEAAHGPLVERFTVALEGFERAHGADELADAMRQAQHMLAMETFERWVERAEPPDRATPCILEAPVALPQLDLALHGACGHLDDRGRLFALRTSKITPNGLDERLALVLQALALEAAGRPAPSLVLTRLDGTRHEAPPDTWREEALAATRRILDLRRRGRLAGLPDALRLAGDPTDSELAALDDDALATGDDR